VTKITSTDLSLILNLNHTDIFHHVSFFTYFNCDTQHTGIFPQFLHMLTVFTDTCSCSYITCSSFLCTKERILLRARAKIISSNLLHKSGLDCMSDTTMEEGVKRNFISIIIGFIMYPDIQNAGESKFL
jgi:hypothetical protein